MQYLTDERCFISIDLYSNFVTWLFITSDKHVEICNIYNTKIGKRKHFFFFSALQCDCAFKIAHNFLKQCRLKVAETFHQPGMCSDR